MLPPSENRPPKSSTVNADSDDAVNRGGAIRSAPLGDRTGNGYGSGDCNDGRDDGGSSGIGGGSVNVDGSRTGDNGRNCTGNINGSGFDDGNGNVSGNGNVNGSGNGDGNGNGSGNGNGDINDIGNSKDGDTPGDASVVDSSLSRASRAELLVRMGLVRARLGVGRAAGDRGLRPVAESLWRDVEELGRSGAGRGAANRSAGE